MSDIRSKRLKRIRIQSFLTCFLSLSTLFAAGSATFAWFSTNKRATAKYMNIVARDSSIVKTANYYKIKSRDVENRTYTFSKGYTNVYDLLQYNRELGDGIYQILVEVIFKKTDVPFKVNAFSKENLIADGTWKSGLWNTTPFPLSSIIQFTYFGTNAVTNNDNTITVTKNQDPTDVGFVTMNGDTPTYTQEFALKDKEDNGEKPIYIMLDYNEKAITSIYSYNIGNPLFEGDYGSDSSNNNGIKFKCDFTIAIYPKE